MATKYFVDNSGNYLGGFDGDTGKIPFGSIEVGKPPPDGRMLWDGTKWIEPFPLKDVFTEQKRDAQIEEDGVTLDDKVNALWLLARGDKTEFERIDAIVKKAESDFPK